jgi:DNA-binding NarL/FixJ family response regulator
MTIDRSQITCVIADDHPPIIDCLSRFLSGAGFEVLGTAPDGEAALSLIAADAPRVCVADVRMPKVGGLELARRVTASGAETAALKDAPLDDLGRALETVAAGGLYVDPVLAAELATRRSEPTRPLSERERQVLRMLAEGGSYAEIGATLFLSPDTVRAHAQRAMEKLGARTRTQAVAVAMREALIA